MTNALIAFASYFATAAVLLAAFVWIYVRVTPYNEFELIAQNNIAAATSLSGAVLGFTFPLLSTIFYTQSLLEMVLWACLTCVVQLVVFMILRRQAMKIQEGHVASALMLATFSIAAGLINAMCISH